MKGNDKVLAHLNDFLADELTAISQYMVHSEMCADWGYQNLHEAIRVCLEAGDNGSRELIEDNLHDEEEHLDWLEAQLHQINQMGLQNYLQAQLPE